MRYAVTGAAGFIGSHLAEALAAAAATTSSGIDCFTDYYDPALKEENARGARRAPRSTSPRTSSTSPASTASSTSPDSRACAASATSSRSTCAATCSPSQRVFEAAARDGVRVVFASSSSVYGAAERYPTPEDTPPRPLSPYGITKLACEHLAARVRARASASTCVVLRYFNAFGPRQRPDMAFTRIALALAEGAAVRRSTATATSRAAGRTSPTSSTATIAAMERGQRHLQRRRRARGVDERGDRAARADLRPQRSTCSPSPPVPGDQRRTNADTTRIRAELGWEPRVVARGRAARPVGMGLG